MTKLPKWLEAELPEMRPVNYIDFDPMTGTFTYKGLDYHTVVEAYDAVGRDDTVDFSKTVKEFLDRDFLGVDTMFTVKSRKGFDRILFVDTDQESREYLEMTYRRWLEENEKYQEAPDDFVRAYHWLNLHPVFWRRSENEKTWHWNTESGVRTFYTMVRWDSDEGTSKVAFEAGGHTPCYTQTYHDTRMGVYENSFEEAYIAMAKIVNSLFNADGTEKKGAEDVRV